MFLSHTVVSCYSLPHTCRHLPKHTSARPSSKSLCPAQAPRPGPPEAGLRAHVRACIQLLDCSGRQGGPNCCSEEMGLSEMKGHPRGYHT